ncbi:unnamed protein product [Pleuronectes platessa]|uniref:Uncharacterized protein n=1 Tax=Pleuronectes platessa TaxID=8262 RepID=A0A9N7TU41_PLEPL|nr:unnamed protein product [Pleuronectes platessa]
MSRLLLLYRPRPQLLYRLRPSPGCSHMFLFERVGPNNLLLLLHKHNYTTCPDFTSSLVRHPDNVRRLGSGPSPEFAQQEIIQSKVNSPVLCRVSDRCAAASLNRRTPSLLQSDWLVEALEGEGGGSGSGRSSRSTPRVTSPTAQQPVGSISDFHPLQVRHVYPTDSLLPPPPPPPPPTPSPTPFFTFPFDRQQILHFRPGDVGIPLMSGGLARSNVFHLV